MDFLSDDMLESADLFVTVDGKPERVSKKEFTERQRQIERELILDHQSR